MNKLDEEIIHYTVCFNFMLSGFEALLAKEQIFNFPSFKIHFTPLFMPVCVRSLLSFEEGF